MGYSTVVGAVLEVDSNSTQFLETGVLEIEIAVVRNPIERTVVAVAAAAASWAVVVVVVVVVVVGASWAVAAEV